MIDTTTPTIPAGITQLGHRCWELFHTDTGYPYESGDAVPHFDAREQALSLAEGANDGKDEDEDPVTLDARQAEAPCYVATAACGDTFDYGEGTHWATAKEAWDEIRDSDWSVREGVLRCEDGAACKAVSA